MRKIISFMHISLDGFVAGPNGEMNWIKVDEEIFDYAGKRIGETDTALYGSPRPLNSSPTRTSVMIVAWLLVNGSVFGASSGSRKRLSTSKAPPPTRATNTPTTEISNIPRPG